MVNNRVNDEQTAVSNGIDHENTKKKEKADEASTVGFLSLVSLYNLYFLIPCITKHASH